MANKIDNFNKFDVSVDGQGKAVNENRLDSYDITEINAERTTLAREIRQAVEFNDDEKQYYFEKLSNEIDDTDLSAVRQFKIQVDKDRREIRGMIDAYTGIINKNREAFGVDQKRGLDAADQYIEEFMKLDAAGKREWLNVLESDITERLELLRRAKELMPDREDYIKTLRRSEVRELVKEVDKGKSYVRAAEKIFADNPDAFSETEKKELLADLNDSDRHDQARTINTLRTELNERKELSTTYDALPDKYKASAPRFKEMSLEDKRNAMESIENGITADYRNIQRNHPLSKHVSEDSKDAAYSYFRQCSITDKAKALDFLDGQFEMNKELSDTYENLLKQMAKYEKPSALEKLRLDFYKSDYDTKKDKLIPALEEKLANGKDGAEKEKEMTEKYKFLLDQAVEEGHIGKATRQKSLDRWKKRDIEYKTETLENFDDLIAPYKALFERFEALPDDLKKDCNEFFEAGFLRKKELVAGLESKTENGEKGSEKTGGKDAEKIRKQKIGELTRLAADAEREEEYEDALGYYEEILEMNPYDPIAQSRIRHVKSMTGENGGGKTNTNDKEKELVEEALNGQDIKRDREYYTIVGVSADETASSEAQHGTIEASKRQKDAADAEVAEALEKYTEGASVLNKEGEAEEIMEINVDKDSVGTDKLSALKRPVVSDIIKSSDPTASKNIQFVNSSGQKLSGAEGQKQAEKLEEQIKNKLADRVADMAQRRRIKVDEDSLNEILEKKDMQKLDMTG